MRSFKSFFVIKYSQWLNAYSLMLQVVKSPDTYPVQKTLGNAQADNIAKDSHDKNTIKKKKKVTYLLRINKPQPLGLAPRAGE